MNNKKKYNGGTPQFIGGLRTTQLFLVYSIIFNIIFLLTLIGAVKQLEKVNPSFAWWRGGS